MSSKKVGFAIGNGTSREHFDLRKLTGQGVTIGCNYIVNEFQPDIVVTLDIKPEISFRKIARQERDWLWLKPASDKAWMELEEKPVLPFSSFDAFYPKHNSGIIACTYLAEVMKLERVYMVGFDFFRIHPGMERNDLSAPGIRKYYNFDVGFNNLSIAYPDTEFIRVGPTHPHDVKFFKGMIPQFRFIDYLKFEVLLETNRI